jgi:hypothetical protein
MIELHPNILRKDGKDEFVVLPYDEFVAIQELLDDLEDLLALQSAKKEEVDAPTLSLEEVRARYEQANPTK